MRRATVSTTDTYQDSEPDPEIVRRNWEDQVSAAGDPTPPRGPSSRSRSRSRRSDRSNSPTTSLNRRSASPTRHAWYSSAYPEVIGAAQDEPVCSPMVEDDTYPVGYIYAPPYARVQDVMETLRHDMAVDSGHECVS